MKTLRKISLTALTLFSLIFWYSCTDDSFEVVVPNQEVVEGKDAADRGTAKRIAPELPGPRTCWTVSLEVYRIRDCNNQIDPSSILDWGEISTVVYNPDLCPTELAKLVDIAEANCWPYRIPIVNCTRSAGACVSDF